MENIHKLAVMVPLNENGANALEWGTGFDERDFRIAEISPEQYNGLFWLFDRFNSEFNLLIDRFEEETLPPENLERAIEMTAAFIPQIKDGNCLAALRKISELLHFAKSINAEVLFDF